MIAQIQRREILMTGATLAGVVAASGLHSQTAYAEAAPVASGTAAKYESKPLPFDPQKISGFSEKILVSHHDNNYVGAVKRLNAISDQLASLDFDKAPGFQLNGLKREELIAANSMILHEIYFAGIGAPNQPGKMLSEAIARDFGSFDRWRAEFVAMGKAEGGGSGWVLLTYNPHDKRLMNTWAADHTMTLAGGEPILVMDMYEHAYQMDYGAKAGDYVNAFMATINWSNADELYKRRRV